MFDICTDVHLFQQSYVCAVAYSGHFCFGGDLTKLSITIASVDRFYLNFVICLQLDIALLIQNSVIIWHCLSELWQCIQGVTFFVDTVYNSLSSWICMSCVASWLDQKIVKGYWTSTKTLFKIVVPRPFICRIIK